MRIAVTGGTGFIGRSIIQQLLRDRHQVVAWTRRDRTGDDAVEWIRGDLSEAAAAERLVQGCDGLIHAALWRPGPGFRRTEGPVDKYAEINVIGSLRLFQAAVAAKLSRVVFISSGAVHERPLANRPLDETQPMTPASHYGAHKAALECFAKSFAEAEELSIASLRPVSVYGLDQPAQESKYYDLVQQIVRGQSVEVKGGGKMVHVDDVAAACLCLLQAADEQVRGEAFECCDGYFSEYEVAKLAKECLGSSSKISGEPARSHTKIVTDKLESLGFQFGGSTRLRETIQQLAAATSH